MMHKIRFKIELEDGSTLLVSPKHTVYGKVMDRRENLLISIIMVNQSVKDDSVFVLLNSEEQNKASDMDSFVIAHCAPEIFEMINGNFIKSGNLTNFILYLCEQCKILPLESFQCSGEFIGNDNLHKSPHQSLNSSKVMGFLRPDLISLNTSSVDLTTSFAKDSLTSLLSAAGISDISATCLSNSSSFTSSNLSDIALIATEDQSTHFILDISSSNSLGILIFNSTISTTNSTINSSPINNFSLLEEVSGWDHIIADERFKVTADETYPGDVSPWTSVKPWGTDKDSGVTVTYGQFKDLYLAFQLKGSGTGNATISVLGEVV